jgi:WD40 repeat protein
MQTFFLLAGLALGEGSLQAAEASELPAGAPAARLSLPPGAVQRFGDDRFRVAGWPLASALSPDGARLAVLGSARGRNQAILSVFDAETGRPLCRAAVESAGFFATPRLAFSPDGKYVAATITSQLRVVWAATGELVTKLPPSKSGHSLCQFTPDGFLAVTETDHTDLYAIPAGKVAKTWPVGRIARLTPDAKTFVRIEKEFDAISIGNPATGVVAGTLAVKTADNGADNGLAFSADGTKLAVVHDRERIQIWDTPTRQQLAEERVPLFAISQKDPYPYYAVAFSPDGQSVVLETQRGEIERWETRSLTRLQKLSAPRATYIRGVHWSKDGRTILAVASNGLVHRWDAKTGKRSPDDGYSTQVRFAVTPNGASLVAGDFSWRIDVWDLTTGRVVRNLEKHRDWGPALMCLAISPDGQRVAVGEGGGLQVFRTDGGGDAPRIGWVPRLDGSWLNFLAWAPDGKSVFVGEISIRQLSVADGKQLWGRREENLPSYALTPDGRYVIKANEDSLQFLDAATGKVSSTIRMTMTLEQAEQFRPLRAVACAPDGKLLALAVGQRSIAICDAAGRELRRFAATDQKLWRGFRALALQGKTSEGRYHRIEALAFTPDGKWIVSGADDCSVRVWEAATGKLVGRFHGHYGSVEQVAVAPDGRSAFSAGGDGFVYQWDLRPQPYSRPQQKPDDLWAAAAEPDPAFAVAAAWALVTGSQESREFVADKLPPFATKREEIAKWLANLDSPRFAVRETATKALADQGRAVERQLRETLKATTSAEVRRRAEFLLARFKNAYTADELRVLRLVQACELSGTVADRALLKRWAAGGSGAVLTEDAKAALARLDRRLR